MNATQKQQNPPIPGQRMRFIVGSANEAVAAIKEELGECARVLSVKQVSGNGLARFLSSPRLEVIAWIPPEDPEHTPTSALEATESKTKAASENVAPQSSEPSDVSTDPSNRIRSRPIPERAPDRVRSMLLSAGFDTPLLESLLGAGQPESLFGDAVENAITRLRKNVLQHPRVESPALDASRIAFIGAPGSGKTTALCKWVAREVFLENRSATVLRVDGDTPHFGDGLEVFCEALGVAFDRAPASLPEDSSNQRIFIDVPGCGIRDHRENRSLAHRLDALGADGRVLVINAAYDSEIIKSIIRRAEDFNPTHLVFSHVDLLRGWGKLWPFALQSCYPPVLFLSTGPNVAGDYIEQVIPQLTQKTIP